MANKISSMNNTSSPTHVIDSIKLNDASRSLGQLDNKNLNHKDVIKKNLEQADHNKVEFINNISSNKRELSTYKVTHSQSLVTGFIKHLIYFFNLLLQLFKKDEVFYDPMLAPSPSLNNKVLTAEEVQNFQLDFAKFMAERRRIDEDNDDDVFYDFPEPAIIENNLGQNDVDPIDASFDVIPELSIPAVSIKNIKSKNHYIEYELTGHRSTPEKMVLGICKELETKFKSFIEEENLKNLEHEITFSNNNNQAIISITENAAKALCKKMDYSSSYAYKADVLLKISDSKVAIDIKVDSWLARAAVSKQSGAEWISSLLQPHIHEALINANNNE